MMLEDMQDAIAAKTKPPRETVKAMYGGKMPSFADLARKDNHHRIGTPPEFRDLLISIARSATQSSTGRGSDRRLSPHRESGTLALALHVPCAGAFFLGR